MSSLTFMDETEANPAARVALSPPSSGVPHAGSATVAGAALADSYRTVRRRTEALCEPLATDDYVVQSMPDASPVKWHLAHTTWFFETFVLAPNLPGYRLFHPEFRFLFNSYYQSVGARWPRSQRGLLSRPTVVEVFGYRAYVDKHMAEFLRTADSETVEKIATTVVLGLHHEQQHQELILTDLKHAWSANPLIPVYQEAPVRDWHASPPELVGFSRGAGLDRARRQRLRVRQRVASPPDLVARF